MVEMCRDSEICHGHGIYSTQFLSGFFHDEAVFQFMLMPQHLTFRENVVMPQHNLKYAENDGVLSFR